MENRDQAPQDFDRSRPDISIITAVRNRPQRLAQAIANWRSLPGVTQIVVCDWSSAKAVSVPDSVKLLRVEAEPFWRLSMAFNFAALHATGSVLLKMDVDYRVTTPTFIHYVYPLPGWFSCGSANIAEHPEDRFLCGCICVRAEDFRAVNGYNERLIGYGYDDDDLYNRLREHATIKSRLITSRDGIFHLPHGNRHRYQPTGGGWGANKRCAEAHPWTTKDQQARYRRISDVPATFVRETATLC